MFGSRGESQWNQVRFRIVQFANLAAFISSRRIEITQTGRPQPVSPTVSLQRVFEKQFRCAIRIDRLPWRRFRNWNRPWHPVDCASRRKHELPNASVQRGVQETECRENIIAEIFAQIFTRFSTVRVRSEVHNRVHSREHSPQLSFVGNVTLHKFKALRQPSKPAGKIVVNNDIIAGTAQRARRMTADITCSARYQYRQKNLE